MNALNPVRSVARQFGDVMKAHARPGDDVTRAGITRRAGELLESVRLEQDVLRRFPHELSGGMRQRVAIALALALELLAGLRRDRGLSLLYITHDLLSARVITDELVVLRQGRIVERGPTRQVLQHPQHSYTAQLLDAVPNPGAQRARASTVPNPERGRP